jgi:hypothetical protein
MNMRQMSGNARRFFGLTLRHWVLLAAVLVGPAVAGAYWFGPLLGLPQEEPPIRVKNGSMLFELVKANEWTEEADKSGWSPRNGLDKGQWSVKVVSGAGHTCPDGATATGNSVAITYSDNFVARIGPRQGSGRLKVGSRSADFTKGPAAFQLRYPTANENGWIKEIRVTGGGGTWRPCTFASRAQLVEIRLCDPGNPFCQ